METNPNAGCTFDPKKPQDTCNLLKTMVTQI